MNANAITSRVPINFTESFSFRPLTVVNNSTSKGVISDELLSILIVISCAIICGFLTIFGSITNIMNIIVFLKIGFKDSSNISLFVLAVCDFCSCVPMLMVALCFNPYFTSLELPFQPVDFTHAFTWAHIGFTRVTCCITAFITFERCLCVTVPLKIRDILTHGRVIAVHVCITIFVFVCCIPSFIYGRYTWRFSPKRNTSIIVLEYIQSLQDIEQGAFIIHGIIIPTTVFIIVVVCTSVLVMNLRQKTRWREDVSASSNNQSTRDSRVAKMVVMISTLFIVCYIPVIVSFFARAISDEYHRTGRYKNMYFLGFSYHFVLEMVNSSLNIFIYYRMSTSYRNVFLGLFGGNQNDKKVHRHKCNVSRFQKSFSGFINYFTTDLAKKLDTTMVLSKLEYYKDLLGAGPKEEEEES